MKTKVKVIQDDIENNHDFKKNEIGYIDGYVRGGNNRPYASVIIDKRIVLIPFNMLEVLPEDKIICAAVHYDDGIDRTNQNFLPRNIKTGVVLCGWRHHNCINIKRAMSFLTAFYKTTQGFLTSGGNFVNREEAYKIHYNTFEKGTLFSEDLY